MKKFIIVLLGAVFLFSSACGPKEKNEVADQPDIEPIFIIPNRPNPLETAENLSLELAVFEDDTVYLAMQRMAEIFAGMYPNVTLNITVIGKRDDYAALLKEKMLTEGYAPDLLLAPPNDEFMFDTIISERLTDIYNLMYDDPNFTEDDWFINAVHAFAIDGKLYVFPIHVRPLFFSINEQMQDDVKANFKERTHISFFELLNIYNQTDTKDFYLYNTQYVLDLFRYTFDQFVDKGTNRYNFTDPQFMKILEPINHFYSVHYQHTREAEQWSHVNAFDEKADSELFLFQRSPFSAVQYILPLTRGNPSFTGMVPLADSSGRIILDNQTDPIRFSIHKDSAKKELAWEVVKFFARFDYHDSVIQNFGDQIDYFLRANKSYIPVYKLTLEFVFKYYFKEDFAGSGLATYNQRYSIADEERVPYLMDFYEKIMAGEMTYIPDHWQLGSLFNGFLPFYMSSEDYGFMAIMGYVLEEVQKLYENMILSDPDLIWAKGLVEKAADNPDNAWMFMPHMHYQDKWRMERLMHMEFIKMIYDIGFLKLRVDELGDIAYVKAKLTQYSFDIGISFDNEKQIFTYYTDETERLTQQLWKIFLDSLYSFDWGTIMKDFAEIESELERYEVFNEFMAPYVNAFLDAYTAEHGEEALIPIPAPAEFYKHVQIYEQTAHSISSLSVNFTNTFGDRLMPQTWDSFWELTDHDFDWLWKKLLGTEDTKLWGDIFTEGLTPFIESFLINMGL
ncbi:MAG: hypothetical protein FWE82_10400 [Defluviitaleaceae bacterium]|nr:hypothetical protein [Defluviitaleaceae bacterium]